jgi:iron complex outermembrane recepter protein
MKVAYRRLALLSASCLATGLALPTPVFAQAAPSEPVGADSPSTQVPPAPVADQADTAQSIGDIVVTAQKRSERLQDVPIAVTAIEGESLTGKGISTTLDIQQATPGLNFTTVIGTASPRIRGIGTGSAIAGNENSVATYIDGVYIASSAGSVMQLANIAQVAVLKGPQGTLFGRNATGGLIQITTLDPKQEFSGKMSATYGNHNTYGGSAYVTGGIAEGIAADLTLYYTNQTDGFGINRFSGRDVGKSEDFAVRSKWIVELGDLTRIKIAGDYSTSNASDPARRLQTGSRPQASFATAGVTPFTGNPFDVNSNIDPFYKSKRGGASVELIHSFDSFDFSSLTAFRQTRTRIVFDTDATSVFNADTDNILRDKQFSQEFQLTSTGSGPFKWTLGAYYFDGKGGYAPAIVHRPPNITTNFTSYQRTKAPAVYGQASYDLTEATTLTLGGRYSWEKRTQDASGSNATGTGPFVPAPPLSATFKVSEPSWRASLDHRLSPELLVYASYNRGFKSGGFVPTVFTPPAQTFDPEILDAFEVGFKSDLLDRRVRLNGSSFYYDYKDIQITAYGTGPLPTIVNAASAKIYGVDLDLVIRPTSGLSLTAGFSYIHSRFGSFNNAQIATPLPTGGNSTAQGSATGNELPNTPDYTINLGADYDVPVGKGGITFSTNYFHSDGWFAEPDNVIRQRPYDTLGGSITWYSDTDKTYSFTAWARNLTNEVYATQLQARTTGDVVQVAPGRTFGVTAGLKF